MPKISVFKTDQTAEVDGTWLNAGGISLLVARMGNKNYREYMERVSKNLLPGIRVGQTDKGELEKNIKLAMSKHVLLDWRNLTDDADQQIPYSPEKAFELFNAFPDFFKMVADFASDIANFKERTTLEQLGNSEAVSSGS